MLHCRVEPAASTCESHHNTMTSTTPWAWRAFRGPSWVWGLKIWESFTRGQKMCKKPVNSEPLGPPNPPVHGLRVFERLRNSLGHHAPYPDPAVSCQGGPWNPVIFAATFAALSKREIPGSGLPQAGMGQCSSFVSSPENTEEFQEAIWCE